MSFFSETIPRPVPNMDDAGFWEGCAAQHLRFQHCADCGTARHPPTPICPKCRSAAVRWKDAPVQAEVYTFTVIHYAAHPAVKERLPYVAAVLTFDGMPGVRLVTNITGCAPSAVRIGLRVNLWWDDVGEGMFVPRFSPAAEKAA